MINTMRINITITYYMIFMSFAYMSPCAGVLNAHELGCNSFLDIRNNKVHDDTSYFNCIANAAPELNTVIISDGPMIYPASINFMDDRSWMDKYKSLEIYMGEIQLTEIDDIIYINNCKAWNSMVINMSYTDSECYALVNTNESDMHSIINAWNTVSSVKIILTDNAKRHLSCMANKRSLLTSDANLRMNVYGGGRYVSIPFHSIAELMNDMSSNFGLKSICKNDYYIYDIMNEDDIVDAVTLYTGKIKEDYIAEIMYSEASGHIFLGNAEMRVVRMGDMIAKPMLDKVKERKDDEIRACYCLILSYVMQEEVYEFFVKEVNQKEKNSPFYDIATRYVKEYREYSRKHPEGLGTGAE